MLCFDIYFYCFEALILFFTYLVSSVGAARKVSPIFGPGNNDVILLIVTSMGQEKI